MSHHNARTNMLKQQLRTNDILEENILSLFEKLPRDTFVPENMQSYAYSDMQIPLPHNQRMLTPLEEATILQALHLKGHETILEIGTGSGYLTALLSRLCRKVISIEYFNDILSLADKNLRTHHIENIELILGDGSRGWVEKAPYDVVVMTGAIENITEILRLQVIPGGKLITIVGKDPVMHCQIHTLDHQDNWEASFLFETNIPPLIDLFKPKEFIF